MPRSLLLVLGFVMATATWPADLLGDEEAESVPLLTVSTNRFGSTFELVTIDIHGENAELVLPFRCAAENPCWSPDLRKIAYRSNKSGQLQLYVYDFDRNEETNVTKSFSGEHEPTWSPDGKKMLFTSQRAGNHELFLMDALMVYDVETLEHTPVAPEGMRTYSRVSWKPMPRKETPPIDPFGTREGASQ